MTTSYSQMRPSGAPYSFAPLPKAMQRVLALSPGVDLSRLLRNVHDLHHSLVGLLQLATLSDRVLAWPMLPCNASWLIRKKFAQGPLPSEPPLHLRDGILPFLHPSTRPLYACIPSNAVEGGCMASARAMLPHEFDHWKGQRPDAPAPAANNTVLGVTVDTARMLAAWPGNSSVAVISAADAGEALERVRDEAVVYVGYPVLIGDGFEDASDAFKKRAEHCQGLHRHWSLYEGVARFVLPGMPAVKLGVDARSLVFIGAH